MTKFTEQDLLNSVKLLNESLRMIEGEHMGDMAELQSMFTREPTEQEASPSQSSHTGTPDEVRRMIGQFKQQELAVQPGGLDDTSKQSTSSNFERPFYDPKANQRDKFSPKPEDSFYNPSYDSNHFQQDFTQTQRDADKTAKLRQSLQGQQSPQELIRTPNGPRKITLNPTDKIAEDIKRIMQIAKWQGYYNE